MVVVLRLRRRSHLLGRLSVNLLLLLTGGRSGRLLPLLRLALVVNRLRRLRLLWRRLRLHRCLWLHRRLGLRRWLLHGCLGCTAACWTGRGCCGGGACCGGACGCGGG